jgi:hypothetical protein
VFAYPDNEEINLYKDRGILVKQKSHEVNQLRFISINNIYISMYL